MISGNEAEDYPCAVYELGAGDDHVARPVVTAPRPLIMSRLRQWGPFSPANG